MVGGLGGPGAEGEDTLSLAGGGRERAGHGGGTRVCSGPMAGKKGELLDHASGGMIDAAERAVREKGVLVRARLPGWKGLSAAGQGELVGGLLARGLEVGDKGALRVPLGQQVLALARGGGRVPLAVARRRLAGGAAKDKDAAVAAACATGDLHLVVRTKVETLVGGGEAVLAAEDVDTLVKAHAALGAVLKLVGKKGAAKAPLGRVKRTLLVEDVAALVAPLARLAPVGQGAQLVSVDAAIATVLEHIRMLEEPPISLVWVPDLVKSLAVEMGAREVVQALLSARSRALVELRPESGVGRLSQEDAALCPPGPDGVPLSHVRSLAPG